MLEVGEDMKETILHNELGEPISTVLFIFFTENY